jgi:glycosyltransferase involved in cell wall biosynthesis
VNRPTPTSVPDPADAPVSSAAGGGCRLEGGIRARLRDGAATDGAAARRTPLISVVTAVFNDAAGLESTIHSVLGQTCRDFEYLVIDGGSSDGTVRLLQEYDRALEAWVSEPDLGVYDAFNRGVRLAAGTWIVFLGAGDRLFDESTIQRAAAALQTSGPDVQLAYGRVVTLKADGSFVEEENEPWATMQGRWQGGRPVMPHHQGVFQRRIFLLAHPFDLDYRLVADYKVFMTAVGVCPPLYIDARIAKVQPGGLTTMPEKAFAAAQEILRLNRELGLGRDHLPHQAFFWLKCLAKTALASVLSRDRSMQMIDLYRRATGRARKWT